MEKKNNKETMKKELNYYWKKKIGVIFLENIKLMHRYSKRKITALTFLPMKKQ